MYLRSQDTSIFQLMKLGPKMTWSLIVLFSSNCANDTSQSQRMILADRLDDVQEFQVSTVGTEAVRFFKFRLNTRPLRTSLLGVTQPPLATLECEYNGPPLPAQDDLTIQSGHRSQYVGSVLISSVYCKNSIRVFAHQSGMYDDAADLPHHESPWSCPEVTASTFPRLSLRETRALKTNEFFRILYLSTS